VGLTLLPLLLSALAAGAPLSGKVSGAHHEPIPFAYVATMNKAWQIQEETIAGEDGSFRFAAAAFDGLLMVQPPAKPDANGINVFTWQPRVFAIDPGMESLALSLPPAVTYYVTAYTPDGQLMRWKHFKELAPQLAPFLYATDADGGVLPATVWPVFGTLTGSDSGPRDDGLPALVMEPGQTPFVNALYWPLSGHGKLHLRVPAPTLNAAGQSKRILWNHALAQEQERLAKTEAEAGFSAGAGVPPVLDVAEPTLAEIRAWDDFTSKGLAWRNQNALRRAAHGAETARKGKFSVALRGADGTDYSAYTLKVTQRTRGFLFGAYEGSPYNEQAYSLARDAGCALAVVLPAWGWCKDVAGDRASLNETFGLDGMRDLGLPIKVHGATWMLDEFNILPKEVVGRPAAEIIQGALAYQAALLKTLAGETLIWEVINEPATTNSVGLSRSEMIKLMQGATQAARAAGKPTLVNSPPEFDFGRKFQTYTVKGQPQNAYPDSFVSFLKEAQRAGALKEIDIIGLQVYPGFHWPSRSGVLEGPCLAPADFARLLDTFAAFGKSVHVTEFSIPSSYGDGWRAGHWPGPWSEATQAEYTEAAYRIAFGHPAVGSIGWWDITDAKPSMVTGGLVRADGTPKPAYERMAALIAGWTSNISQPFPAEGRFDAPLYSGAFTLTVEGPGGYRHEENFVLFEGWSRAIEVTLPGQ